MACQAGTGALSMDDIEVLRNGSHVIFNRPGQGFLSIVDESRLKRPTGYAIFRMIYYMCIPFCDEETQRQGPTVLHNGTSFFDIRMSAVAFCPELTTQLSPYSQ